MQLNTKPSNASMKSQFSISSVSSAARKFMRSVAPAKLRHTQSMPLYSAGNRSIVNISPPLTSTAVDVGRGRYMRDKPSEHLNADSLSLAALTLPFPPIQIQNHWIPAGEAQDGLNTIFEPRPAHLRVSQSDSNRENIFEPRQDPSSPEYVPSHRQRRQRSVSFSHKPRPQNIAISTCNPRLKEKPSTHYPPQCRRDWCMEEPLDILRPLSPVCEEDPTRRYAGCFPFNTFQDLVDEVVRLDKLEQG